MDLLVDIGNSRLKWATIDDGEWCFGEAVFHSRDFRSCVAQLWAELAVPDKIALASVASSEARQAVSDRAESLWQKNVRIIGALEPALGIRSDYAEGECGVDRWLAVVGARSRYSGDLAVVDCGSAVNIEFLSEEDRYLGGMILPGQALMYKSLRTDTAMNMGEPMPFNGRLGQSTDAAVSAGVVCALAGAVENAVQIGQQQHKRVWHVIVTGGDAAMLTPYLSMDHLLEPNLVLLGMSEVLNWQE